MGRWFDISTAKKFKEEIFWDGNNHISKATGSQWEHESLYITKGGVFIKNSWSEAQGGKDVFEIITRDEAAEWFVINEYADELVPENLQDSVNGLEVL